MPTPRGGRRTIFSWASPGPSKSGSGGRKIPTTPLNPPDRPDATKIKLRIRLVMHKGVSGTQLDKRPTRTDTSLTPPCRVSKTAVSVDIPDSENVASRPDSNGYESVSGVSGGFEDEVQQ